MNLWQRITAGALIGIVIGLAWIWLVIEFASWIVERQ